MTNLCNDITTVIKKNKFSLNSQSFLFIETGLIKQYNQCLRAEKCEVRRDSGRQRRSYKRRGGMRVRWTVFKSEDLGQVYTERTRWKGRGARSRKRSGGFHLTCLETLLRVRKCIYGGIS